MKDDLRKLIDIFDLMTDGVCLVDKDFTIEYMNSVLIEDFGDGLGKKCFQILENRLEICPRCMAANVFNGEKLRREIYSRNANKFYDIVEAPFENEDGTYTSVLNQDPIHYMDQFGRWQDIDLNLEYTATGDYWNYRNAYNSYFSADSSAVSALGYSLYTETCSS